MNIDTPHCKLESFTKIFRRCVQQHSCLQSIQLKIETETSDTFSYCIGCRKFASINNDQQYNAEFGFIADWQRSF